jgi:uncharacterized protein YjbI with pentapeptide repeats
MKLTQWIFDRRFLYQRFAIVSFVLFILVIAIGSGLLQKKQTDSLRKNIKSLRQEVLAPKAPPLPDKELLALKKDLLSLEKDAAAMENAIYGSVAQILGAFFFLVTAYLTLRNVRASEDKQVTERFSKAIDQLSSDKSEVQLGGLYALERIARDSKTDHWTIMEVLTAFVLSKSALTSLEPTQQQTVLSTIQAALSIIARRNTSHDPPERTLNLAGLRCASVDLSEGKLAMTNFSQGYLPDGKLVGANLDHTIFNDAILTSAFLDEAGLEWASLIKANLSKASLNRAQLQSANLSESKLDGATLIEANLHKADCSKANLSGSYLTDVNLTEVILSNANLTKATCIRTNFYKADLEGTNLCGANLSTAIALTQQQLDQAILDDRTQVPKGLKNPHLSQT